MTASLDEINGSNPKSKVVIRIFPVPLSKEYTNSFSLLLTVTTESSKVICDNIKFKLSEPVLTFCSLVPFEVIFKKLLFILLIVLLSLPPAPINNVPPELTQLFNELY